MSRILFTGLTGVFTLVLLSACAPENNKSIDRYFDLQEFLDRQVSDLDLRKASLVKTSKFGDSTESIEISGLDSSQWQKELRIFREHDINKPVLIDAYQTDESVTDHGHQITSYKLIDTSASGVLNMEVVFDSTEQVSSWKSDFQEQNLLYCNFREVSLTTGADGVLNGYLIQGYHKLMFNDTVYYQLKASISTIER